MTKIIIKSLSGEIFIIDLREQKIMQDYMNDFKKDKCKDFEIRLGGKAGLYKLRLSES